jgi:hypothetical protein
MIFLNLISSNRAQALEAFALLAERKIAISTKSFAKAAIAPNPFLFIAVQ